MTLKEQISQIVKAALAKAIDDGKLPKGDYPPVKIEYPREAKFGDYASPIAMESAKIVRQSPVDIGNILKSYIEAAEIISSVEVVKPGFINIYIDKEHFMKTLSVILSEREKYGRQVAENPRRINIEFVSANPTGPMNVVSARAAAIGDTVANLFEAIGHKVDREYYVNDYGNQFLLLGKSVLARIREQKGLPSEFPEDGYHGEYIKDIAMHIIDHSTQLDLDSAEEELIDNCAREAVEYNVEKQKKDLMDFNVVFDNWFRERSLHEKGEVEETQKLLIEKK